MNVVSRRKLITLSKICTIALLGDPMFILMQQVGYFILYANFVSFFFFCFFSIVCLA